MTVLSLCSTCHTFQADIASRQPTVCVACSRESV